MGVCGFFGLDGFDTDPFPPEGFLKPPVGFFIDGRLVGDAVTSFTPSSVSNTGMEARGFGVTVGFFVDGRLVGDGVTSFTPLSVSNTGMEATGFGVTRASVGDSDIGNGEGCGDGSGVAQSRDHIASSLQ